MSLSRHVVIQYRVSMFQFLPIILCSRMTSPLRVRLAAPRCRFPSSVMSKVLETKGTAMKGLFPAQPIRRSARSMHHPEGQSEDCKLKWQKGGPILFRSARMDGRSIARRLGRRHARERQKRGGSWSVEGLGRNGHFASSFAVLKRVATAIFTPGSVPPCGSPSGRI